MFYRLTTGVLSVRRRVGLALLTAAVTAAGSCASDGSDPVFAVDAAQLDSTAPSFAEIEQSVLVPSCVLGRCHITQAPAGGLSLTGRRISAYDALVGAPSTEVAGRIRVVPFDPEASYLMEKLTAMMPTAGTPMPPMARLPEADIARIRAWIAAGAPNN